MGIASADLSIQLAPRSPEGLMLDNPVIAASGTFGYGIEYYQLIDIQKLGAVVCKGTTLMPKKGNPQPRMVETTGGLLNSIGLENIGVDAVIRDKAPVWAKWRVPVIVNVAGETMDEYIQIVTRLEGVPGVSGIELNISCPNISGGRIEFGVNPQVAAELTSQVKAVTSLPLIVKLSPNVTDIREIALAVEEAGADAISLINGLVGMAIDINTRRSRLGKNLTGGVTGPCLKPIALRMVWQVAQVVNIPVIGIGGITGAEDALEFFIAGATAIEIGTYNLIDPKVMIKTIEGIRKYLIDNGINSINDIIGSIVLS